MFSRTVLGLDIGSYSVKAVELRAGLRDLEFLRLEEARFSLEASPEERGAVHARFCVVNATCSPLID